MIPISQIRNNSQEIIDRLARRGVDRSAEINRVAALDEEARAARFQLEQNLSRANQLAREIGDLFKSGKKDEAEGLRQESTRIKEENKGLEETLTRSEQELKDLLLTIPNAPSTQVKTGRSADDNEVVSTHGEIPKLHEDAKPHWELAKTYDLIDFELGVKITGAGFPVYKGAGARLHAHLSTSSSTERAMPDTWKSSRRLWSTKKAATEPASCRIRKARCTMRR